MVAAEFEASGRAGAVRIGAVHRVAAQVQRRFGEPPEARREQIPPTMITPRRIGSRSLGEFPPDVASASAIII